MTLITEYRGLADTSSESESSPLIGTPRPFSDFSARNAVSHCFSIMDEGQLSFQHWPTPCDSRGATAVASTYDVKEER